MAVALLALAGCGDGTGSGAADAAPGRADAGRIIDAAGGTDGSVPLGWIDFAIGGCPGAGSADAGTTCTGSAPLELRFSAVAPAPVELYRWSFGDGTGEFTARSPTHTFDAPGAYDISLTVAGPGGTARVVKEGVVEVVASSLGAACDGDAQCESGTCACGDGPCPAPLEDGLCTATCGPETPCESGVCADLAPTDPADPESWQAPLCVQACDTDGDCGGARVCADLRAGDGAGWIRGCFAPGVLAPLGAACLGPDGAPDDAACASGFCAGEGARGMCAAACTDAPCPAGGACATFAGELGALCVRRCEEADEVCASDPWLACEPPGGDGARGFTVDEDPAPAGYCAPKTCTGDGGECGPDGACTAGFCGPA